MGRVTNVFTVDVEDYFQEEAFQHIVSRETWPKFKLRVHRNIEHLLGYLENQDVNATFFILGWIAQKDPEMVKRIAKAGHEIASHGFNHQMITKQTPEEFREDINKSKRLLEDIAGQEVIGYRAPTYSVVKQTLWALRILFEEGYKYDSSIYPITHDRYGISDWKRMIHPVLFKDVGELTEIPLSTIRFLKWNLPIGSGEHLRMFPVLCTFLGMKFLNSNGMPAVVNIHPWEIDYEQPRLPVKGFSKFRHYNNIDSMGKKIKFLLKHFTFSTAKSLINTL